MAIARAFTNSKRHSPEWKIDMPLLVSRAATTRGGGKSITRAQISAPVALVSTTNGRLHEANDIAGTTIIDMRNTEISSSTSSSGEDSDRDLHSDQASNHTGTDASSVDESPSATNSFRSRGKFDPEPNHLTCYFPSDDAAGLASPQSTYTGADTPRIPQRVPSHSKKAHETLHRQRSLSRVRSPSSSGRWGFLEGSSRSSREVVSPGPPSHHEEQSFHHRSPPSSPRRQASEDPHLRGINEEMSSQSHSRSYIQQQQQQQRQFSTPSPAPSAIPQPLFQPDSADPEVTLMRQKGLAHFTAADYSAEIRDLVDEVLFAAAPAMTVPAPTQRSNGYRNGQISFGERYQNHYQKQYHQAPSVAVGGAGGGWI